MDDRHPSQTGGKRFVPLKRKISRPPESSDSPAFICRTKRQAAILDNRNSMLQSNLHYRIHLTGISVCVLGDNHLGPSGYCCGQLRHIHIIHYRLNICINRLCPQILDRIDVHNAGITRQDDFVARPNSQRPQNRIQSYPTFPEGKGMLSGEVIGELIF